MRSIIGAALVAMAIATMMPSPAHAQRNSSYSWTGPYVGANLGYQWGSVSNNSSQPTGAAGGIQGGYNWQYGQFVFGGETDLQLSGAEDVFAPWKFSNPWFGTTRARAGIAVNNVMFYGTGGFAYGTLSAQNTATGVTESKSNIGLTGGLGMEVGFYGHWTARVEYLYVNLGDRAYSLTGTNNGLSTNLLRLGVNYRF